MRSGGRWGDRSGEGKGENDCCAMPREEGWAGKRAVKMHISKHDM